MNKLYILAGIGAALLLVTTKPRAQVATSSASAKPNVLGQITAAAGAASSALAAGSKAVSAVTGAPAGNAAPGAAAGASALPSGATSATINAIGSGAVAQTWVEGSQIALAGSVNPAITSTTLSGGADLFAVPAAESLAAGESIVGAEAVSGNVSAAAVESGAGLGFAQMIPFAGIALVALTAKKPPPETAQSNARAYGVSVAEGEEIRADHSAGQANDRDVMNWWAFKDATGQDEYLYRMQQNAGG